MKLYVCVKCDKAKKKKVADGETRIDGNGVYRALEEWLHDHPEIAKQVELKPSKCLDECKRGPNACLKPGKEWFQRLTLEKLETICVRLQQRLASDASAEE